jgi:6-phosphogluconolactonase
MTLAILFSLILLSFMCPLSAADPLVLVGGYDPAVRAFSLSSDGVLHPLAISPVGRNPSFLAVSADAKRVYACDEVAPGRVVACDLDRDTGALRVLGSASSGGKGPCFVAIHPDGRLLFAANYGDGRVAVLPLDGMTAIGEPVSAIEVGANAHMALPASNKSVVYVPCKGADRIVHCTLDPATGTLSPAAVVETAPGAGPRHLVLDGSRAWLVDELANAVQPATIAADGGLTLGAPVTTLPADWNGRSTAGGIVLFGGDLLVSNRGHDSLAMFTITADGIPVPAGHVAVGKTPRHIAVSPDGRFVLVACQGADRIDVLRRDGGRLLPVGSTTVPRPAFVGCVP